VWDIVSIGILGLIDGGDLPRLCQASLFGGDRMAPSEAMSDALALLSSYAVAGCSWSSQSRSLVSARDEACGEQRGATFIKCLLYIADRSGPYSDVNGNEYRYSAASVGSLQTLDQAHAEQVGSPAQTSSRTGPLR